MNQFFYVDLIFHFGCLVLFTWNLAHAQSYSGRCITPHNLSGNCISIKNCKPYLELLREYGNSRNESILAFLKSAQCGFEGKTSVVCCPRTQRPVSISAPDFEPTLNLPIHTGPKDVSNHPLLRQFLPEMCGIYTQNKITGGNAASLYEFPWMALLGYNTRSGFDYRCGGSLINTRYVLTAAHCIKTSDNLKLVEVRLGEFNQDTEIDCQVGAGCADPVQDFLVEEAIPHQNYVRTGHQRHQNDIGLVRLNRDAVYTPTVSPICLPIGKEQQERSLEGENLIATGWGVTESGSASNVLLKVKLPATSVKMCAKIYERLVEISEKQLCAGGVDLRDSCTGDSGGPLQQVRRTPYDISYVQFGIVSFGPSPCGFHEKPGVYTRVGYYMDWILNNMHL